jgi:hypothetical protein
MNPLHFCFCWTSSWQFELQKQTDTIAHCLRSVAGLIGMTGAGWNSSHSGLRVAEWPFAMVKEWNNLQREFVDGQT